MGFASRKPTSNEPARPSSGKSPYLQENECADEIALLLSGTARRCGRCKLSVRTKYLEDGLCPDCKTPATKDDGGSG